MGQFLYAIPNVGTVTAKKLEEVGLAGIFKGVSFSQRHTTKGPGGGECTLICIGDDAKSLFFKPDEQKWQQSLNEKYRLGFYEKDKPIEENLQRKKQLAGHEVELGDGAKWLMPIARIITGGSRLPSSLILGKNGEVFIEELPQYAGFGAKAEKLWADFLNENSEKKKEEPELSVPERMAFAIEALAWNYHIGTEEVNLLKLITTQNLSEIMAAIIDVPTLVKVAKERMEAEKKNKGPVTTDGG